MIEYLKNILENMPEGWLGLTTHRLDIYNEDLAKTEFLDGFERLFELGISDKAALEKLPTAYDYIRLGHPLSCILEWALAKINSSNRNNVISFASATVPILAVLRKNKIDFRKSRIAYTDDLPASFVLETIRRVYGYDFEAVQTEHPDALPKYDGSTIFIAHQDDLTITNLSSSVDFYVNIHSHFGSVLFVNVEDSDPFISEIQHVRRRETVAMTPYDAYLALEQLVGHSAFDGRSTNIASAKAKVLESINTITGAYTKALLGSSGLSIQYAIMMGLIHDALENHGGKAIKFIVPPNCYGGTNDQARRVAACTDRVEVVDLPVDRDNDMVRSIDRVLDQIAGEDAVPYIIAEIPTNPRLEVPDLDSLKAVLSKVRKTEKGNPAIEPVFILDQTFCPNVHFLGENETLACVPSISYASGSKFPSGGQCTAGYCVGNKKAAALMGKIEMHLKLCDNEATSHQMEILASQLPSMKQRIADAYQNTREFVKFINETLPEAKVNFVSPALAAQGFTPSVFSLDLPTHGATDEEKELNKRTLNHRLIDLMITKIPDESKYCVSYGQLKGCYWTIPATSTQGTTKEGDKDYIVRASVSPNLDLEHHKQVFADFVDTVETNEKDAIRYSS